MRRPRSADDTVGELSAANPAGGVPLVNLAPWSPEPYSATSRLAPVEQTQSDTIIDSAVYAEPSRPSMFRQSWTIRHWGREAPWSGLHGIVARFVPSTPGNDSQAAPMQQLRTLRAEPEALDCSLPPLGTR